MTITRPTLIADPSASATRGRTDADLGTPGVTAFTPIQLLRTAHLFALDPELPQVLAESVDGSPERPWTRLARTPHLEVWLLGWPAGAQTEWHDHGNSKGAFVTVAGTLREWSWSGNGPVDRLLPAGEGRAFGGRHIHNVVNDSDEFAISVHAYSPSLAQMTRYRFEEGRLIVDRTEAEGRDW